MNKYLLPFIFTIAIFILSGIHVSAQDIASGEGIFKQTCAACHSVGKGRLVGPDLVNIHQRRPQDWILKFVKSSQSVVKSGDKYADSLFQAFNQTIMPDQPTLSDDQIKNVLSYIETKSSAPVTTGPATSPEQTVLKPDNSPVSLFTTTNIYLLGLIVLMLLVILHLWRTNKSLADQIRDYYSSNKSFFK